MIAGTLEIQLMANVARLAKDMHEAKRSVSSTMQNIERSVETAKRALAGLGIGLGAGQLIKLTDEYSKLTAQLKLAATSAGEYSFALEETRRISRAAQSDISATGMLYARIANGTRELGLSQQKISEITETVSLGLRVSGATAEESASAILQLSQAFSSGVLRGEEFNAVNEAAPRLMKAIADGIGAPVGALKKMAEEGKLTSSVLAEALPRALQDIRKESESVQTISGAFTVLKNNVMEFVGTQAQASGAVTVLAGGIRLVADNLTLLAGVSGTIAASKFAQWMSAITVEAYKKAAATIAETSALQAQRAATIAATSAEVARLESLMASITADRARTVAQLQSAQATVAATAAIGAHSAALHANAAASVKASAAVGELAALGRLQATTTAQLAVAQTALSTATAAGAGAAGLASRALGLLGGPVGWITTLLGLGATAWAVWGNKAESAESVAKNAVKASTQDILDDLEKQIAKLKERNALAASGLPGIAKSESPAASQMARLKAQMDAAVAGTGEFAELNRAARNDIAAKLGAQYGALYAALQAVNAEKEKLENAGNASKLEAWLAKNNAYLTDTEKLAQALKKAKEELGDAYSPDVERRIRDSFAAKDAKKLVKDYEAAVKSATDYIKTLREESDEIGLNADQIRMLKSAREAAKAPTAALRMAIMEEALALDIATKAQEAKVEADKQAEALEKAALERSQSQITAAFEEVAAMQKEVETFGMLPSVITEAEVAKLELLKATLEANEGTEQEIRTTEALIQAKKRLKQLQIAKEDLEEQKRIAGEAQKVWERFTENIQRNLGDVLYNGLQGKFEDIGDAFKSMLLRMLADAMAADLTAAIFNKGKGGGNLSGLLGGLGSWLGGLGGGVEIGAGASAADLDLLGVGLPGVGPSGLPSADGGGFTGAGPRSGGIDGKGGFLSILHPQETVLDHTRGQTAAQPIQVTSAPVIHIDARTDAAQVRAMVTQAVQAGNAQLVDQLSRARRI